MLRLIATLVAAVLLCACAGQGARRATDASANVELRLPPASLGRELALQQQLSFEFGKETRTLDALLEADSSEVRLAVQAMSQSALRLRWDGQTLDQQRAEWLPPTLRGERVLSDLQLAYWPVEAIRAALPAGWRLDLEGSDRQLREGDQDVTTVHYPSPDRIEIVQHRENFRLVIVSVPIAEASP